MASGWSFAYVLKTAAEADYNCSQGNKGEEGVKVWDVVDGWNTTCTTHRADCHISLAFLESTRDGESSGVRVST